MWLDRLKELKKASGFTTKEISDRSGLPGPTLEKIFAGSTKDPKLETMRCLVYSMGFTLDDLMETPGKNGRFTPAEQGIIKKYRSLDGPGQEAVDAILDCEHRRCQDERQKLDPEPEKIIYLYHSDQKASAGTGFVLDYEQMNRWAVRYNDLTRKADFCVAVSGQSMEPMFFDGDVILVQTTPSVDIGEVGLFVLDGNGYVKKRGADRLISLNPDSSDVIPAPLSRLDCMGRVLGVLDPEWVIES